MLSMSYDLKYPIYQQNIKIAEYISIMKINRKRFKITKKVTQLMFVQTISKISYTK